MELLSGSMMLSLQQQVMSCLKYGINRGVCSILYFFFSRIHGSYIDEPSMNQSFDLVICLHFIIRGQVSLAVKTSDLGTGSRFDPQQQRLV